MSKSGQDETVELEKLAGQLSLSETSQQVSRVWVVSVCMRVLKTFATKYFNEFVETVKVVSTNTFWFSTCWQCTCICESFL